MEYQPPQQLYPLNRRHLLAAALCNALALTACGGGGSGNGSANGGGGGGGSGSTTTLQLLALAGNFDGRGAVDGTGAAARFDSPSGVAADAAGNVYVADTYNHTIRKITAAGVVTTLAGKAGVSGTANGSGTAARFNTPYNLAADAAGNVYVADTYNHTIRKITPAGVVSTLAGSAGVSGSSDGSGTAALLSQPVAVAVDSSGTVYVADSNNNTIRKITPAGLVSTLAGTAGISGSTDATGALARFNRPSGIAVDSTGTVYVADTYNRTIRKIDPAGVVTTLAGNASAVGTADGTGAAASFGQVYGLAVDADANVYVAESFNETIRKITPSGVVTTIAGTAGVTGSADGTGATATFFYPGSVAVASSGVLYVADAFNHTIRKIAASGAVTTFAGTAGNYGATDATGTSARFYYPFGTAVDASGNVYVADTYNHTIRKVTPAGVVSTLAGQAGTRGSADGAGKVARFSNPFGVAVDATGNVYVADTNNSTIRKITPAGLVTTLAGSAGAFGSVDATGSAARFRAPKGVAVDADGNVYVADSSNQTIRKITAAGVVTTLAGTAGLTGTADGSGTVARFNYCNSVAVDSAGNLYVADTSNNNIRKVSAAGVVTTLAGSTDGISGSSDGTGNAAGFNQPFGIAVSAGGTVYVTDTNNHTIRAISPAGVVTTIAGTVGVAGFVTGNAPAQLVYPQGVATDSNGVLYVTINNGVATIKPVTA